MGKEWGGGDDRQMFGMFHNLHCLGTVFKIGTEKFFLLPCMVDVCTFEQLPAWENAFKKVTTVKGDEQWQ